MQNYSVLREDGIKFPLNKADLAISYLAKVS